MVPCGMGRVTPQFVFTCVYQFVSVSCGGHDRDGSTLMPLTVSPFLSGDVPQTFLCHESSRFELIPQSSLFLSCNPPLLSFNFPVPCILNRVPAVGKDLNSFQHFAVLFGAHCSGLQQFVNVDPSLWSTFCTQSRRLSILLAMSCPPRCHFLHVPKMFAKYFSPVHCPLHLHALAAPSTSHASILAGRGTA